MVEIASPWEDRTIIDDPYPFYEKLRESAPVWRVPGSRTFYVAPWALVADVVSRPDDFSSNLTAVLDRRGRRAADGVRHDPARLRDQRARDR